jgi:hypothetical protein
MFAFLAPAVWPVFLIAWLIANLAVVPHVAFAQSDALPSWSDGAAKKSIVGFVARVTMQDAADWAVVDMKRDWKRVFPEKPGGEVR